MATLSMFLAQVLSPDGSCRQAVTEATLKRLMKGRPRCSSRTSAYGQARARLPTDLIVTLTGRSVHSSRRMRRFGGTGRVVGYVWSTAPR